MTIKSTPPASSHLAEIPVPAPAPMIAVPAVTLPCNRRRIVSRLEPDGPDLSSAPARGSPLRPGEDEVVWRVRTRRLVGVIKSFFRRQCGSEINLRSQSVHVGKPHSFIRT